ncbi:MAG: MBL fold metallo-hydrolase [Chitinophagaceae bacterium]|nr:MBL fold metallo-hydrolase [Chitinophagaceae bacterium]HEV8083080.1 MBL fold metallo-hydrolase [Chitinophagaceae bacterium]
MKIAFHGAARTVTGSKHLLTLNNGKKYLLDCGMFQGMGKETEALNRNFGFDAASVDYLILSHAHIDHCGLIPKLVKDGFSGKIFATPATKDLAAILMEDSAGIQESDLKFVNKHRAADGLPYLLPLYTTDDALKAVDHFESVEYDQWHTIDENVQFIYKDAGHIIGSATVHLKINEEGKETHLTFSGDVGRYRDVILKSPDVFPQADYILLESTYGNSLHEQITGTNDLLLQWIIKTCIEKKGKLIIPAFSVGRTQEILFALNQLEAENRLPDLTYIVDSPLSMEATQVIKRYPQYFNSTIQKMLETDKDPFDFKGLKFTKSVEESKMLNYSKEPLVIISASGMAEAGRVKHHISNNIENSRNSILFTGYCEPFSLGGRLKLHPKEVNIFGAPHEVNAEIGEIKSMSAHGDYNDLCQWLACQDPKQVKKLFLVHGEYKVQQDFQQRLISKGFADVEIPERHYEIGLT